MEERVLRVALALATCTLFLFYVIGGDFGDEEITNPETGEAGETLWVNDQSCIYHLIGDMILCLLRAGLHLLWFYYTLF